MLSRLFKRPEDRLAEQEKVQESLAKTRRGLFGQIGGLFQASELTEETWDDLETLLIQADVGGETSAKLVERMRRRVQALGIKRAADARAIFEQELIRLLNEHRPPKDDMERLLTIIMVVGVNGSGKTTSIGKLARLYKQAGYKVVIAAADTFRAAAVEQLVIWGERAGVEVISQGPGADPGAVVYDAIRACQETRRADVLLIDTAGRLHTKYNLMKELEKVRNVCATRVHKAPHEVLLVLDANTGQNAIPQAKHFKEATQLTGVVLTKLDGTAKGGVVFAIGEELGLPVRFVGTGEKITDLAEFNAEAFVAGLFER
ncbi:signal recognition particle-docking protein FtsY [Candidatus Amarolinea aalborgensis]|uniref:signal recognition particle-docking protein FtsY n=1 Tax=Candidatus Amarolinea aalborgensis TaxID=2249329 RepID=UPI003BF95B3F